MLVHEVGTVGRECDSLSRVSPTTRVRLYSLARRRDRRQGASGHRFGLPERDPRVPRPQPSVARPELGGVRQDCGVSGVQITRSLLARLDLAFFVLAGVLVMWFAYLTFRVGIAPGWPMLLMLVFWAIVAYLALPRVHRILTRIYVPDYFIGRTRTADGLLGDPVNLAVMGTAEQIHQAMTDAGWIRADDLTQRTGWQIVTTTLARRSYPQAPVSPLFLFRQRQDFAYQQEVAGSPSKRHHVRFWQCPEGWLLPGGVGVDWLAAGTYDRSVGLSLFTFQVTHKISPHVDEERDHIIHTVSSTSAAASVRVLPDFFTGYHSRNGGGDLIRTDGDLPVIDLSAVRVQPATAIQPSPVSRREARPPQITFGVGMTALRGLVYTILAISLAFNPVDLDQGDPDSGMIAAVVLAVGGLFDLGLAGGVYRGWNWARLLVCGLSLFSAGSVFLTRLQSGPQELMPSDLLSLGISVLVLLALSSEAARSFCIRESDIRED